MDDCVWCYAVSSVIVAILLSCMLVCIWRACCGSHSLSVTARSIMDQEIFKRIEEVVLQTQTQVQEMPPPAPIDCRGGDYALLMSHKNDIEHLHRIASMMADECCATTDTIDISEDITLNYDDSYVIALRACMCLAAVNKNFLNIEDERKHSV